ncbi:MAG: hypothetical protein ABFD50_06860 [Smithella sp.]
MTEHHDQNYNQTMDELQEKTVEKELESMKAVAEEALKKVELLSKENAELRQKLKQVEKVYRKYDHLDGYMEKYGFNTEIEREMWQAIRRIIKE